MFAASPVVSAVICALPPTVTLLGFAALAPMVMEEAARNTKVPPFKAKALAAVLSPCEVVPVATTVPPLIVSPPV